MVSRAQGLFARHCKILTLQPINEVDSDENQKQWKFDEIEDKGEVFVKNKLIGQLQKSIKYLVSCLKGKTNIYLLQQIRIHLNRNKMLKKKIRNNIIQIDNHKQYYTSLLYFSILGYVEKQKIQNCKILEQLKTSIKCIYQDMFQAKQLNIFKMFISISNVVQKYINFVVTDRDSNSNQNKNQDQNQDSFEESILCSEENWSHQYLEKKINKSIKIIYNDMQLDLLHLEGSSSFNEMCLSMLKRQYDRNERAVRTIVAFNCFRQKNILERNQKQEQTNKQRRTMNLIKQKQESLVFIRKNIRLRKHSWSNAQSKKLKIISLRKYSKQRSKMKTIKEQMDVNQQVQKAKESEELRSSEQNMTNFNQIKGKGSEKIKKLKLPPSEAIRKERIKQFNIKINIKPKMQEFNPLRLRL